MGRKPLEEEQKRQQICARFSPGERAAIHERAHRHGHTPNAEVELLATQFLDLDDTTIALFRGIADQMQSFSYLQQGKPWHQTIPKWAAVRELLFNGVIETLRPEKWSEDEAVAEAFSAYLALRSERRALVGELSEMGLPALEEPPKPKIGRGIFGFTQNQRARDSLRIIVRDADEGEARDQAMRMIDQLEDLDQRIEAALVDWQRQIEPYTEAEAEGIKGARGFLQAEAARDFAEGRPTNTLHLVGNWK